MGHIPELGDGNMKINKATLTSGKRQTCGQMITIKGDSQSILQAMKNSALTN